MLYELCNASGAEQVTSQEFLKGRSASVAQLIEGCGVQCSGLRNSIVCPLLCTGRVASDLRARPNGSPLSKQSLKRVAKQLYSG
eukprot:888725-Amphidinium_carterae.1